MHVTVLAVVQVLILIQVADSSPVYPPSPFNLHAQKEDFARTLVNDPVPEEFQYHPKIVSPPTFIYESLLLNPPQKSNLFHLFHSLESESESAKTKRQMPYADKVFPLPRDDTSNIKKQVYNEIETGDKKTTVVDQQVYDEIENGDTGMDQVSTIVPLFKNVSVEDLCRSKSNKTSKRDLALFLIDKIDERLYQLVMGNEVNKVESLLAQDLINVQQVLRASVKANRIDLFNEYSEVYFCQSGNDYKNWLELAARMGHLEMTLNILKISKFKLTPELKYLLFQWSPRSSALSHHLISMEVDYEFYKKVSNWALKKGAFDLYSEMMTLVQFSK